MLVAWLDGLIQFLASEKGRVPF